MPDTATALMGLLVVVTVAYAAFLAGRLAEARVHEAAPEPTATAPKKMTVTAWGQCWFCRMDYTAGKIELPVSQDPEGTLANCQNCERTLLVTWSGSYWTLTKPVQPSDVPTSTEDVQ